MGNLHSPPLRAAPGGGGGQSRPAPPDGRSAPQAQQEREGGTACYGRVSFPCPPGHGRAHRLLLTPQLLHQLQSHFGP